MFRALWCDHRDVLAQITFAQQQCVTGCAAATRFVTVIACFGRFDDATLFVADWRVDAVVGLGSGGGGEYKNGDGECHAGAATEGRPYNVVAVQKTSESDCRGGPPWPPHLGGRAYWSQQDRSPLVKIALAFAAGVVDVDHFQLGVEVERG